MAYLALARKWRPKAFSEVVGQQHVVQALSNALDTGRVHHAFLFTGTRGVGKTTLARIFAKSLNCETGTSAEPCQQCGTCQSIDEGRFVDLIEIDAASNTKVDDTRELLDNVQYAPTSGKYKVYLMDEVHMLSGHSFNALLKTLEEPPEHVKFLFATTDPQKLPVTILSRCLQFNLRAMRPEQVERQLTKILNAESIDFDADAVDELAKAADGSMRDGLSLLDQAIALGGGEVRTAGVRGMLGTIKAEFTEKLLAAITSQDSDTALATVAEMADSAVDFELALDELMMQLYYLSLAQTSPKSLELAVDKPQYYKDLAAQVNPETLQLFYQIGLISKRDIALAPNLRVGFEMALLRMFAFEPADQTASSVPAISLHNTEEHSSTEKKTLQHSQTSELGHIKASNSSTNRVEGDNAEYTDRVQDKANSSKTSDGEAVIKHSEPIVGGNLGSESIQANAVESAGFVATEGGHSDTSKSQFKDKPVKASPEATNDSSKPLDLSSTDREHREASPYGRDGDTIPVSAYSDDEVQSPPMPGVEQMPQSNNTQCTMMEGRPVDKSASPIHAKSAQSPMAVTLSGNNEWGELVEQTALTGMAKELAMNCAADRISEERIDLCLSPKLNHLHSEQRFLDIQSAVMAVTNPKIKISLDIDDSDRETPAECLSRLGFEREEQVRESMHADPGVKSLMSEFGATIKENSIKPLS